MNPELREFVLQKFGKAGKALDLGCGTGVDLVGLRALGWQGDGVDLLTGVDLNEPYLSPVAPYDLVYTNYVIHKLVKPLILIQTIADNLKPQGRFFMQTFDISDQFARYAYTKESLLALFKGSKLTVEECIQLQVWDAEPGHWHYHQILQVTGLK